MLAPRRSQRQPKVEFYNEYNFCNHDPKIDWEDPDKLNPLVQGTSIVPQKKRLSAGEQGLTSTHRKSINQKTEQALPQFCENHCQRG